MTPGEMAGRVEAAEGPSEDLDREIWLAYTPGSTYRLSKYTHTATGTECEIHETREAGGRLITVPRVTASLDAAVAFVERLDEQAWWSIDIDGTAKVCLPDDRIGHSPATGALADCAATPAMALVAAALRALQDAQDGAK